MKKKVFSLMMMLVFGFMGLAQAQMLEVGVGTATNANLPGNTFYRHSMTQQIYTVEELGAADTITSIAFYNGGTGTTTRRRAFDIYLVQTDKVKFDSIQDWIVPTAADLVFSDTVAMAYNEWTTFTLTTPFQYDGTQNVALIVKSDYADYGSGPACRVFNAPSQAIYIQNDVTAATSAYNPLNPVNPSTNAYWNGTILNVKNQVRFGGLAGPVLSADLPTNSYYKYGVTQQLVLADEFEDMEQVASVKFFNTGAEMTRNLKVFMTLTDKTEFADSTDWVTVDTADLVFSGNVTFAAYDWTTINFNHLVNLDGVSNVALTVNDSTDIAMAGLNFRTVEDTVDMALVYHSDDTNRLIPDPYDLSGLIGTLVGMRSQMEFAPFDPTFFDGTSNSSMIPAYVYYFDDYTRSQHVMPATEIGIMAGQTIEGLKWYATNTNSTYYPLPYTTVAPVKVYVKEVESSTISAFVPLADCQVVYEGYLTIEEAPAGGTGSECTVTFSTPYTYNGGNLLVGVENTTDAGYRNINWKGQYMAGASGSGSNGTSTANVTFAQQNFLPKTTFIFASNAPVVYDPNFYMLEANTDTTYVFVDTLNLGDRPNGYWMRPVDVYSLWNHTGNAVNVSRFDFTPEDGFFSAEAIDNELPFTMNVDDTIPMLFTTNITDTTYADTTFWRQFVVIYDTRTAGVWPFSVHAYNPVEPDVFELARVVDTFPYVDDLDVAAIPLYDNYRLPDTALLDGPDAVYEITLDKDVLLNASVTTGANGKVALYTQDFYEEEFGLAGPDFANNYTGPAFGGGSGFIPGDVFSETFYNHTMPSNWTTIDADGDGYNFDAGYYYGRDYYDNGDDNDGCATSWSYATNALDPDDYLVSPQVTIGSMSTFSFYAQCSSYYPETFGVAISTGSNTNANDFVMINSWTGRSQGDRFDRVHGDGIQVSDRMDFTQYSVDLSEYAGQQVYIAIRHFNSYDQYYFNVDDITLSNGLRSNYVYTAAPVITDLPVPAGTYYLVASSTDNNFTVEIDTTAMPCPAVAEAVYPLDNADTIPAGMVELKWHLDAYTTEYCVLFGSTYYCEDTVVGWTSDLAESCWVNAQYHNTNYFWKVCQRNSSCGTGTDGEVWGFTTRLKWPTNLHAQDSSIFVGEDVVMEWTPIEDRTFRQYNIYLDDELIGHTTNTYLPGAYYTFTIPADSLTYNMTPGYRVNVTALYDEGESPYSNTYILKVSGEGTLTGHVYEQDGTTGIADATVTIDGQNEFGETESYTATTNASGLYTIAVRASNVGSYTAQASKSGYQGPVDPTEGNPRRVYYNQATQANFVMDEVFYPLAEVIAEYYPDITSDDEYVKVYWSMNMMSQIIEDFETGDFSQYDWQLDPTYPWQITTTSPYEGTYCMKSGNAGNHSTTSSMQVTVNIPNDGEMSFFAKISSESNWDYGYFYIDGTQMASFTGAGNWVEKVYNVTAGDHTFKWDYTKDGSVSSNDDCFYVDYITFFRATEPLPAGSVYDFDNSTMQGWTTIDADGDGYNWMVGADLMGTGYGHNASNDCVLSQSYSNGFGPLYPDNYLVSPQVQLGGVIQFYACAQDGSYPAEHFGVAVSTTNNTSASAFTTIQEWTMTAKGEAKAPRGMNAQGNWYQYTVDLSAYSGNGYVAIRHFNCSDQFYLDVDDILIGDPAKAFADNKPVRPHFNTNDRAFHHYRIYRTNCYNDGPYNSDNTVLLASDWPTDTVYIDTNFDTVSAGVYKWGVSRVYQGNRTDVYPDPNGRESEIVWSNCLDKDMWLEGDVDITVLLNSADSPEGVTVSFENLNPAEQELYPMDDVVLDWTGQYIWEDGFRKGEYQVTISNPGYETIVENVSIWNPTSLRYVMIELLNPLDGLYVSRTGWAMWPEGLPSGGGVGPTPGPSGDFTEGFENGIGDWTLVNCNSSTGVSANAAHTGDYGFAFHWSTTPPQYLISPSLAGVSGTNLSFYYKQISTYYVETFSVGYSTTTNDVSAFTFGAEVTATTDWTEYTETMPAGTKYIAIKCTSDDQYYLYLDDFTYGSGRSSDRHIEGYKVLCESIDHEPIFNENTYHNFCQVATDQLVEGEHYICKVAIIYSTGQSEWTEVEWEYEPCDNYANVEVEGEASPEGNLLTWGAAPGPIPGTGDEFTESWDNGLNGWTNIDADGDGHMWYHSTEAGNHSTMAVTSHSGAGHIMGESYCNATWAALTPNDFLVSPQMYAITNGSVFSFWACAQDVSYAAEHFGVAVSTTGNTSAADFTTLNEWTLTAKSAGNPTKGGREGRETREGNWYQYTCDLSDYAGQSVWIAIRHFNCTDQFIMCMDDAELSVGAKGNRAPWDLMMTFEAAEGGQYGIAYDGTNFYTSNWGYTGATNNFYKYDLQGNMIEGFNISGCGTLRGMTYDGTYFYGVANSNTVYCVDLANHTLVNTFTSSYGAMRGITYDPVRNGFWVIGNWSGNLTLIDMTGAIVQVGPAPTSASDLAYYMDENNVEHVFCFNNGDNGVYDYNITTNTLGGSVFNFSNVPGFASGSSGGCNVGSFNNKMAFMGDIQQSPNLIGIYELRDDNSTPTPTPTPEGILGYMIFRDGEWVAELPATATGYLDEGEFGDHDYLVRVIYDGEAILPSNNYYYAMSCGYEVYVEGELVCEPGDPINGEYYYIDGEFGAHIYWGTQVEPISEWLYYDNGTYDDAIGTGDSDVYWGIMIPSSMLAAYDGTFLTKVALYEDAGQNTQPITLNIYYGGTTAPATLVHTQNVTPVAADDFHEIALTSALPIDVTQNLWITVKEYGAYPATGCTGLNDPNGRWISLDGIEWMDVLDAGLNYTWLLRGFVTNEAKGVASELTPIEFVGGGNGNVADLARLNSKDAHRDLNVELTGAVRSEIIAYNIYRSTDGVLYDLIATLPAGEDYYEYYDEIAAGNYYYQVTAVYDNGCESDPAPYINDLLQDYVMVEVTGVDDNNSRFALYPNPTNGLVKIEAAGMNRITVVSALGQVVYDTELTADEYQINMAQFSAGVYMVRVATETGVMTQRVTVVK